MAMQYGQAAQSPAASPFRLPAQPAFGSGGMGLSFASQPNRVANLFQPTMAYQSAPRMAPQAPMRRQAAFAPRPMPMPQPRMAQPMPQPRMPSPRPEVMGPPPGMQVMGPPPSPQVMGPPPGMQVMGPPPGMSGGANDAMLRQQMLDSQFQQQRQSVMGGLSQAQQGIYREAQGLGGGIDPLAVTMGGPNALAQARQYAMGPAAPRFAPTPMMPGGTPMGLTPAGSSNMAAENALRQQMVSQRDQAFNQPPRFMGDQGGMFGGANNMQLLQALIRVLGL